MTILPCVISERDDDLPTGDEIERDGSLALNLMRAATLLWGNKVARSALCAQLPSPPFTVALRSDGGAYLTIALKDGDKVMVDLLDVCADPAGSDRLDPWNTDDDVAFARSLLIDAFERLREGIVAGRNQAAAEDREEKAQAKAAHAAAIQHYRQILGLPA